MFDCNGLEEESPQQWRRKRARSWRRKDGRKGKEAEKWVGVPGRLVGGWESRKGKKRAPRLDNTL